MMTPTLTKPTSSGSARFRVRPAPRGRWRVEDAAGIRATCPSLLDAERAAERLVRERGGGELFVYDAYHRVHAVRRLAREK
jgi:hypothetical protein